MGALTLKSFPFELRGWDIEKFESIDPTDGFGTSTRVYISKQQVIQIEPDHSKITSNAWLSDKGRQFFDGIFGGWDNQNKQNKNLILKKETWQKNIKKLLKTIYLFEHCNAKIKKNHFLTIVFENLGLETLSLLKIMEQNYPYLKLRRAEELNISNDYEFDFQLNGVSHSNQLKSSTLCLLVGTNPRYEGYHLNLNLRQRYLKGNFRCLTLGSFVDLTFPTTTIGTNLKILKQIVEGNSFVCQDFKTSKNPLLIFGQEFHKRKDSKTALDMFKNLQYTNIIAQSWNGLNTLNTTLSEVGIQNIAQFSSLKKKDLNEFSSLYFLNVNAEAIPNLKKVTEAKLLNCASLNCQNQPNIKKLFFDHNSDLNNNQTFVQKFVKTQNSKDYNFLPAKMFYENEETYINTEGLIKRTNKLITNRKTREGWKLLRNLIKQFRNQHISLNSQNSDTLSFNLLKRSNFVHFINFHYCAIEKLDSSTPSLSVRNHPFFIAKTNSRFKQNAFKLNVSKSKYWLDDFFTGGKDEYSRNSLVLSNCSKILRTQSTNFF